MTVSATLRLLAVMALWASCFPLITMGLDLAPHLAFAAMRAALAGICLLFIGSLFGHPFPRGARNWSLIALTAVGATTLGFLGMFHAAEFISPGLATVIANTQPLFAAALAWVFLGERLIALAKTGLAVGLTGVVAIAWPRVVYGDVDDYTVGIIYVVLAAAGVAIGNIAIKRLVGRCDAVMAMGFQLALGALPLAIFSWLGEDLSAVVWSVEFAGVLAILSVFGTALPFWLWFHALGDIELTRANAFTFLVPIFGLMLGAAFFEERLGWAEAAGVALTLFGIFLVHRDVRRAAR